MSKRFGRQQKRKLRAEISELEKSLSILENRYKRLDYRAQDMADQIYEAKCILGHNSAFFKPESISVITAMGETRQYNIPTMQAASISYQHSSDFAMSHVPLTHVPLDVLATHVREDYARQCVHVVLSHPDGSSSYAVTKEALHSIPARQIKEHIAMSLASNITRHLCKVF